MARISLEKISTKEILAEITRRKKERTTLLREKTALTRRLKAIDAELGAMGKKKSARRPAKKNQKRARNVMTLPEAMLKVMSEDKAMSVPEIASAASKAGYKSTSKTFHTIIYQTLARDKRFKKTDRGQYVVKPA